MQCSVPQPAWQNALKGVFAKYYIQNNDILYALPNRDAQIAANKTPILSKILTYSGVLGLLFAAYNFIKN